MQIKRLKKREPYTLRPGHIFLVRSSEYCRAVVVFTKQKQKVGSTLHYKFATEVCISSLVVAYTCI
jgi:hypothetical protein